MLVTCLLRGEGGKGGEGFQCQSIMSTFRTEGVIPVIAMGENHSNFSPNLSRKHQDLKYRFKASEIRLFKTSKLQASRVQDSTIEFTTSSPLGLST